MDLIYTDSYHNELGVLQNFDLDFDTTSSKDYRIILGVDNMVLKGGYYWYIEGTEYGGRVDRYRVEENTITYTGRNFRGILNGYIVEPLNGYDYALFSGSISDITYKLIKNAGLLKMFTVDISSDSFVQYRFNRYITLYQAIQSMAVEFDKVPKFYVENGVVHISFENVTDYTDDVEYTREDFGFAIEKSYASVNHLICLGQGELSERQVVHLYADANGNISEQQYFYGEDEITETYENTGCENIEDLKADGISHFEEIKDLDAFEVTTTGTEYHIGDVIGGLERITETYVAREIENIIFKASDDMQQSEYLVGEDDTANSKKKRRNGAPTTADYGLYVTEEGALYIIFDDDATVPEFTLEDGFLYVTADDSSNYNYDADNGVIYYTEQG